MKSDLCYLGCMRVRNRSYYRAIGRHFFNLMKRNATLREVDLEHGRIAMFQDRHRQPVKDLLAKVLPDCVNDVNRDIDHNSSPTREQPMIHRFVYEVGDWLAGVSGIYRLADFPSGFCGLGWTGVEPYFQRHGVGTKLLNFAEDRARLEGCHSMIVWADHGAIPFYSHRGYHGSKALIGPLEEGYLMFKHLKLL